MELSEIDIFNINDTNICSCSNSDNDNRQQ